MTELKIYKTTNLSREDYTYFQLILVAKDKYQAIEAFNEYISSREYVEWNLDKVTEKNIKEYDIGKIHLFMVD